MISSPQKKLSITPRKQSYDCFNSICEIETAKPNEVTYKEELHAMAELYSSLIAGTKLVLGFYVLVCNFLYILKQH